MVDKQNAKPIFTNRSGLNAPTGCKDETTTVSRIEEAGKPVTPLTARKDEHFHSVAEGLLKYKNWKECPNRKEFEDHLLRVFIAHYGLRCTCADAMDFEFQQAAGHYQRCELWKFCHAVGRSIDWAELHK